MINLLRIDGCPLQEDKLSFALKSWLSIMADTLNTTIEDVETSFNNLAAPQYTTVQIATLAMTAKNGSLWYDTDLNQLKVLVNGVVKVVTVT